MNDEQPVDGLMHELEGRRRRDASRRVVGILLILWLVTAVAMALFAWKAYFSEKEKSTTLAEQVRAACNQGDLGGEMTEEDFSAGLSPEEEEALCNNADRVIEENDPELQDEEFQDEEIQDPEYQEAEIQDPELADAEKQEAERQDAEAQEAEEQDAEVQEDEIQDPEIDDPENQDPEIDDPDPADDDIKSGSCTFNGKGTIVFKLETDSGPMTFECTGTQEPDPVIP